MGGARTTYTGVAQAVHWVSALLILIMLPQGLIMKHILDAGPAQDALYRAHVGVGLAVLALTAFPARLAHPAPPAPPPGLSALDERAFVRTHLLLYAVLVLVIANGVGMLVASGLAPWPAGLVPADIEDVPPRLGHAALSRVFIALLAVHLAGVLLHQLRGGDALARMGVRGFGRGNAGSADN